MKPAYTEEQIKKVITDSFFLHEVNVEGIYGDHIKDGNYVFRVEPFANGITMERIADKLRELHDSGLFQIYSYENYYMVVYLNPYVLERRQFRLIYKSV